MITDFHSITTLASMVQAFGQSNPAGKVIVILLILFSLLAWTVMLGKYYELNRIRSQNHFFEKRLSASTNVLQIDPAMPGTRGPYAVLARDALRAYKRASGSAYAIEHVENALQRAVARGAVLYEARMIILGSIVSGAPFLGLLGTVWGVMDAFGAITGGEGASIASLAPGVSGALLTTVAGLLVAIPAVFGYNFLLTQVKMGITELENFASNLADRIELEARKE